MNEKKLFYPRFAVIFSHFFMMSQYLIIFRISEASELVRLFTILKPESKTAQNSSIHSDDIQKIEVKDVHVLNCLLL